MNTLNRQIMENIDYETFISIISDIPSCIFFKDTELKYKFSSHFWAQLQDEDIVGKTDLDIRKDKENAIKAMDADKAIISSKKGCKYRIKSDIDGDVTYLELIKEPVLDSAGEVIGIVGLINDVTEQTLMEKKIKNMSSMLENQCQELESTNDELRATLEKVEQMHEAQKMFTASMNHELRSPLNGIIGNLQLLMDDESLNSEQQENLKNAFTSSQLMLEIVNELLDFAKMNMNGFDIKNEVFALSDITDNIVFQAKTQASSKGLSFELEKDIDIPNFYKGDETRIAQIMHNFVTNAIKYTDAGHITLKISYKYGKMIISCSDTGQGISQDAIDSLFDPFVRLNEKKNAKIQGTGLGLSIVKKIIDSMKGEISVDSQLNVGSTFTATIPVSIATEIVKETAKHEETTNVDDIDFANIKALCIDDSKVNATVMSSLLKKIGIPVADVAFSGKEGIAKADENEYDVIFMDHMMPEMDGVEAFEIIRQKSLKNFSTPVVMLTGNAEPAYVDYYKSKGLDGYLAKPVLKDQIIQVIASIMA